MMPIIRPAKFIFILSVSAIFLAACSTNSPQYIIDVPTQLTPLANSEVESDNLPPLGSEEENMRRGQNDIFDPNMDDNLGDPALIAGDNPDRSGQNGSIINIDEINNSNITPNGRDIGGSLTVEKLLGTWIVSAGEKTCKLNLTQTAKSGTNRYRASTPGCDIMVLSLTSSWQLAGSQVQLFDASGSIIGAFQRSGNRFIGTLSGGIAAFMDG